MRMRVDELIMFSDRSIERECRSPSNICKRQSPRRIRIIVSERQDKWGRADRISPSMCPCNGGTWSRPCGRPGCRRWAFRPSTPSWCTPCTWSSSLGTPSLLVPSDQCGNLKREQRLPYSCSSSSTSSSRCWWEWDWWAPTATHRACARPGANGRWGSCEAEGQEEKGRGQVQRIAEERANGGGREKKEMTIINFINFLI